MSEVLNLILGCVYFCMFIFFTITCVHCIRGFKSLKSCFMETAEDHQKSIQEISLLYGDYIRYVKSLSETVEDLEQEIDELRIQVGILTARIGDYRSVINLPLVPSTSDIQARKKPGWPKGRPRKLTVTNFKELSENQSE